MGSSLEDLWTSPSRLILAVRLGSFLQLNIVQRYFYSKLLPIFLICLVPTQKKNTTCMRQSGLCSSFCFLLLFEATQQSVSLGEIGEAEPGHPLYEGHFIYMKATLSIWRHSDKWCPCYPQMSRYSTGRLLFCLLVCLFLIYPRDSSVNSWCDYPYCGPVSLSVITVFLLY